MGTEFNVWSHWSTHKWFSLLDFWNQCVSYFQSKHSTFWLVQFTQDLAGQYYGGGEPSSCALQWGGDSGDNERVSVRMIMMMLVKVLMIRDVGQERNCQKKCWWQMKIGWRWQFPGRGRLEGERDCNQREEGKQGWGPAWILTGVILAIVSSLLLFPLLFSLSLSSTSSSSTNRGLETQTRIQLQYRCTMFTRWFCFFGEKNSPASSIFLVNLIHRLPP